MWLRRMRMQFVSCPGNRETGSLKEMQKWEHQREGWHWFMITIPNTDKWEVGVTPLLFQEQEKLGRIDETKDSRAFLGNIPDKAYAEKATRYMAWVKLPEWSRRWEGVSLTSDPAVRPWSFTDERRVWPAWERVYSVQFCWPSSRGPWWLSASSGLLGTTWYPWVWVYLAAVLNSMDFHPEVMNVLNKCVLSSEQVRSQSVSHRLWKPALLFLPGCVSVCVGTHVWSCRWEVEVGKGQYLWVGF